MAYSKTTWKNRVVQNPQTYLQQQNTDGTVTLIPKEGTVTEAGTPVNAVNMNNIEDGIATVDTNIATVDTNLGNINDSTLDASVKGKSLTEMIKVLFQNVDNGKNDVYSAIVGKGTTPTSKNFADLVAGINAINTGKQYAQGSFNMSQSGEYHVNNLKFTPSCVLVWVSNGSQGLTARWGNYYTPNAGSLGSTYVNCILSGGFSFYTQYDGNTACNWIAYE